MNQDIIPMAREAGAIHIHKNPKEFAVVGNRSIERFAALVAAAEREALEAELLKLKQGIAGPSQYIQGRWDLIGEVQDLIRARGETK